MEDNFSNNGVEFFCCGFLRTGEGETYECDFTCKQTRDGSISGEITSTEMIEEKIWDLIDNFESFNLEGEEKESGHKVCCKDCYMTSSRGFFSPTEIEVNSSKLSEEPCVDDVLRFDIVNMDETYRISVQTDIGRLTLSQYEGADEAIDEIKQTGRSSITSYCKFRLEDLGGLTLREIISEAEEIMSNFLRITSLGQGCYHDWCNLRFFEKDEEMHNLTFHKYRAPKPKPPSYKSITNKAHSRDFMLEAFDSYEDRLDDLYDFNIALEWYLESNIATIAESKFLMAFTALELLVQRYSSEKGEEFIINEDNFEELREELKETSRDYLKKELKVSSQKREEFYSKLLGINRRPIRTKIKDFLEDKDINYKDIFPDLSELTNTRHRIVHEGSYSDFSELADTYYRSHELLTRIFLRLLNYNGDYYSPLEGEWVSTNS